MDKDGVSEKPYGTYLNQGENGSYERDARVKDRRSSRKELGPQRTETAHHQPAEKHKGYGDLIAIELGEKFSNSKQLDRDRGYPRPNDRWRNDGKCHLPKCLPCGRPKVLGRFLKNQFEPFQTSIRHKHKIRKSVNDVPDNDGNHGKLKPDRGEIR